MSPVNVETRSNVSAVPQRSHAVSLKAKTVAEAAAAEDKLRFATKTVSLKVKASIVRVSEEAEIDAKN